MRRLLVALALALAGCPDLTEAPIPETCGASGAKCKLGNGPLGVCVETSCRQGETAPCFVCQPQH